MRPRGARSGGVVAYVIALALILALMTGSLATAGPRPVDENRRISSGQMKDCRRVPDAKCGSTTVLVDPTDSLLGTMKIGYELHPRRDRSKPSLGTIVAVEGGPGYATTASRDYYLDLFEPMLNRRRLLLVDNRGTGRSGAILCQPLQSYEGDYVKAVGKCGGQLAEASDVHGSAFAADDLAAVLDDLEIDQIDLYGDSYGTFFSQSFAVRHPERVRSLVLDGAYFVAGTDPFYIDTNRSMRDAFRYTCERSPSCAGRPKTTNDLIGRLTQKLRKKPITGRAPNADGEVSEVTVDVGGLIYLTTAAATSPTLYRELDAAMRAALRAKPYNLPLLRLARETYYVGGAGPVRLYSEGLYVAVACNDYPLPFDRTSPVGERPAQYKVERDQLRDDAPYSFAPFTIHEWVTAPVEYFDICLNWPVPSTHVPAVPQGATFPNTPTLVINGDLDSLTSPEGGRDTAEVFPNSTYVEVANTTHVTALGDFNRCASRIVRRFMRTLTAGDTSCASEYNELRLVERFDRSTRDLDWGTLKLRTARVAAATVADVIARWLSMGGFTGVGLQGGTFETRGGRHVTWDLDDVRWVGDVRVSGTISWDRTTGAIQASVSVRGKGAEPGNLALSWNDWDRNAQATAGGTLGGTPVGFTFPAP